MKKKAFTLIELIAVLVILAILALIVTSLVMSIIRKAKISADKRSVDAYGRSVELAIANYLLDNGDFPTDISHLTIEYTGDEVVCSTSKLNSDSSVYLSGCTVGGRSVEGYTYGKEKSVTYNTYSIGDQVTYNNVDYYVIADSSDNEGSVTLLKKIPLTTAEVNQYGIGHLNRYSYDNIGTVYNNNGYGGNSYYTSKTCGYVNNSWIYDGCTTDYEKSEVKYVVDAWAEDNVARGLYEARLITFDELKNVFGYTYGQSGTSMVWHSSESTPDWVYNTNSYYWTMSKYEDSSQSVYTVEQNGHLNNNLIYDGDSYGGLIRPVIILDKSVIED